MAFLLTHFSNHALGLVSVEAMETARKWFNALWRNPLGTALLYGALLVHFALAMEALLRRRTLLVSQVLLLALYPAIPVHAQTAPVGQGFPIDAEDLRFIFHAIEVAQAHSAGGALLGTGPNQVNLRTPISAACDTGAPCPADPQLPVGLRTVDGTMNNLVPIPDQHLFGAADRLFPRLTTKAFRAGLPAGATHAMPSAFRAGPTQLADAFETTPTNRPAARALAMMARPSSVNGPPGGTSVFSRSNRTARFMLRSA